MKLYQFKTSGNCYKIRLALSQLEKKYEIINLPRDDSRLTYDFLSKSPFGKVPLLEDNGYFLIETISILSYLAKDTKLFPKDLQPEILKWLSIEQSMIQPSIAIGRFYILFENKIVEKYIQRAKYFLKYLNEYLSDKNYLVSNQYTIADISVYSYVHLSPEIEIFLNEYPFIVNWIFNVEKQPNYIPIYQL